MTTYEYSPLEFLRSIKGTYNPPLPRLTFHSSRCGCYVPPKCRAIFYKTARRHITEVYNLYSYRCENLKSHAALYFLMTPSNEFQRLHLGKNVHIHTDAARYIQYSDCCIYTVHEHTFLKGKEKCLMYILNYSGIL